MFHRPMSILLAIALFGATISAAPQQKNPKVPPVALTLKGVVEVAPAGDAHHAMALLADSAYASLKDRFKSSDVFLRWSGGTSSEREWSDAPRTDWSDTEKGLLIELFERAFARSGARGEWWCPVPAGYVFKEKKEKDGKTGFVFKHEGKIVEGVTFGGEIVFVPPSGAKDPKYVEGERKVTWTLPSVARGQGRMKIDLRTQARIMTGVYKVYGLGRDIADTWVAKAVIRNTGDGPIQKLRVRFRLQGYSDWSLWQKCEELAPGQTIQCFYHPVLEKSVAALRSDTPADLVVEWKYETADGKEKEDSDGKRVVLLGANEFAFTENFSNAPLLAAWVSRDDPPVKEFAAMAAKKVGGVGAVENDQAMLKSLAATYDLLLENDFTYQHPPSVTDRARGFDPRLVQNVKFPRDVMRDKSGTCIDLAILYAAMVHSIGARPYLVVIPGHCFPIVEMPQGGFVAVETTGVGGGKRGGSLPFEKVREIGQTELEEAFTTGNYILIDLKELWMLGVANPELENLSPDILAKWGLKSSGGEVAGGGTPKKDTPIPTPSPVPAGQDLVGSWEGNAQETDEEGNIEVYDVTLSVALTAENRYTMVFRAEIETVNPQTGDEMTVELEETLDAVRVGNSLTLTCKKKVAKIKGTGVSIDMPAIDSGSLNWDGVKLTGTIGNAGEGFSTIDVIKNP